MNDNCYRLRMIRVMMWRMEILMIMIRINILKKWHLVRDNDTHSHLGVYDANDIFSLKKIFQNFF